MLLTNSAKNAGAKAPATLLPPHFFGLALRNGSQAAPGGRAPLRGELSVCSPVSAATEAKQTHGRRCN